ncbi:MAG TPA: methyltransferase domain-containing protein [Nitrospiraceae bacterium]|nr:methyltransferase domain-containing protein [Nitrospiraceae bacterium]
MSELLIGCGNSRVKKLKFHPEDDWTDLTTMDHDPDCGADVGHDLEELPWPFEADSFDEVHAYCVLEHLGRQGDYRSFFAHFYEIWRVLKPGGILAAHCPSWKSEWAWADPSHTRIIAPGSLVFLNREQYQSQVGTTAMTDFRWLWKGDFEPIHIEDDGDRFTFGLRAHKPVRYADA